MADIVDLSDMIRTGRAGGGAAAAAPANAGGAHDARGADDARGAHDAGSAHAATDTTDTTDTDSDLIRFEPGDAAPDAPEADMDADVVEALGRFLDDSDTPDGGAPLSAPGPVPDPALDWSNQELADLYRVQRLLAQAGIAIGTDRGVTDEGDPWFVFLDGQGEVFVHLCRIGGVYILDSAVQGGVVRGPCFRTLIDAFAGRADTALATGRPEGATVLNLQRRGKIVTHPGAALAALIWTLYLANDALALIERDAAWPEADAATGSADTTEAAVAPDAALPAPDGVEAASPAPDFEDLFAAPQDAADFLADAKAARDASLRAVSSDGRDGLHSPVAALAHPLGATALGLSALAVAYGVTWGTPDTETAALDGVADAKLPARDGADATLQAESDDARGDDTTKAATAAPIFAGDPAHEDAHADETVPLADRAGEAADTTAAAALSAAALFLLAPDAALQAEAGGADADDVAPGMDADRAVPGAPGSATRPDDTEVAQRDAGTQQSAESGTEAERGAPGISSVLSGTGLSDLPDGDLNVFSFAAPSVDAAQGLFDIIDEMIVVSAGSATDTTDTDPGDDPVVAATVAEESVLVQSVADTVEATATPKFSMYSEDVRVFIDYLVTTSQVEVITYRNEVLLIDRRALDGQEGAAFARSWSYEDGGVISTVGIKADFEAFDLTV